MKNISIDELADINAEIYAAALRVGCTDVSLTSPIWPGGEFSGVPAEAARFVEFSWCRAVAINGKAVFEETAPKEFAALLTAYGLGEEPFPEPTRDSPEVTEAPPNNLPAQPVRVILGAAVLPATQRELERQATAAGLSVGEFLDWKFQAPINL